MLYMISSVCIDDQFIMKSYKKSQGLYIHNSFDSPSHYLSSLTRSESTIQDDGGGKEEEENNFFSESQEKTLNFFDSKFVNNVKNNLYFEKPNEMTPTSYKYTYTNTLNKLLYKNQGNGNISSSSIYTSPYKYISRNIENLNDTSNYSSCIDANVSIAKELSSNTDRNLYSNDITQFHKCCRNTEICSQIFKSLLQSKSLQNHTFLKINESDNNITLCKDNNIVENSVKYPYRTVSHFGFNSPIRHPQPNHKHIAVNLQNEHKYVPLRRSISYEEIFSSSRYLNLCEYCFELIVRLKPELIKCDIKLNNSTEYNDVCFKLESNSNKDQSEASGYITNSNKLYSEFGFQLDPVEEIEENCCGYQNDTSDMSISTFHNKITQMNYSDLCSKTDYTKSPDLVTTPTCLSECDFGLNINNSYNKIQDDSNNIYITELYDFNNFVETNNKEVFGNTVKIKKIEAVSNKFMNCDEHLRRKLEFRELLKEHISFNENNNTENTIRNTGVKSDVSNISSDVKDVNDENSSTFTYTNKSNVHQQVVEEFNKTLSRLTISSTEGKTSKNDDDSFNRIPIMNIENDEIENIKSKNNGFGGVQESPTKNRKIIDVDFCENDEDGNSDKYSPLERTILRKIHTNKLNKIEDIFEKIENTIRNKRTPSKLELMIKDQVLLMRAKDKKNQIENLPNKSSIHPKLKRIRKSHSPPKIDLSTPKSIHIKASSVSTNLIRNTASVSETNSNLNNKASKCRNFILENIRNVSNHHHTPQIKRLQNNVDNKNGKSFTCLVSHENNISESVISTANKRRLSMSPRNTVSSGVYPFQSKLIKGSPKYWISMSRKGTPEISKKIFLKNKQLVNSSFNMTPVNPNVVSTVDEEINALGAEIQQMQPRLENYKRKLDEFGNRVADCVNNFNECMTTQDCIIDLKEKLKNCIQSHQYSEDIMCRVQTFSLSETED